MRLSFKNKLAALIIFTAFFTLLKPGSASVQSMIKDTIFEEKLRYHPIRLNTSDQSKNLLVSYRAHENQSTEILRMIVKTGVVLVNNNKIPETEMNDAEGWNWKPLENRGFLTIWHHTGNQGRVLAK